MAKKIASTLPYGFRGLGFMVEGLGFAFDNSTIIQNNTPQTLALSNV